MPVRTTASPDEKVWALFSLPPLPAVAMRVLQLVSRDDVGLKELSVQIQADPALSSELLTVANSPLFGFRREIRTVLQAAALLGTARVKSLALTIAMKVYLMKSFQIPTLLACWRHSLATALIAEQLALASMMEKDFGYLAGILHDVGRLALGMIKPGEYANLLDTPHASEDEVLQAERDMFDVDHCEAGRSLTENWNLPPELALVAAHHHERPTGKFDSVALIYHSCRMADALGFESVKLSQPPAFEAAQQSLPEYERSRFQPDPEQLATDIAVRIQSLG